MDKDTLIDILALIDKKYYCKCCIGRACRWCMSCKGSTSEIAIKDMIKILIKECDENGKSGNIPEQK